ncbi:MAG TPA: cytochrome c [Thermoanaerobaculia bacterium]|nr:cytochrome c [Thermoanaerobaculia bacterium]
MKKTAILIAIAMLIAPLALAEDGAALYKAKCQMCHGPDGAKLAKANLSAAGVQGKSDADLVKFLINDTKHKPRAGDAAKAKALVTFLRTLKK